MRIFGGWREAFEAAGVAPTTQTGRRFWTEERVERELRAFVADGGRLPRYSDFAAAGKRGLYRGLLLTGGVEQWASRLGLSAPPTSQRWTDERIARELAVFLRGRETFPPGREFRAAGRGSLHAALRRHGGVRAWAARTGLPLARPRWDERRLLAELRMFVGARDTLPSEREFRERGRLDLLGAMRNHGGASHWAARLGVGRVRGGRRR